MYVFIYIYKHIQAHSVPHRPDLILCCRREHVMITCNEHYRATQRGKIVRPPSLQYSPYKACLKKDCFHSIYIYFFCAYILTRAGTCCKLHQPEEISSCSCIQC